MKIFRPCSIEDSWLITQHDAVPKVCKLCCRLKDAGAVLIAKLATGEMAYDDVWFDGFTKNPWNIAEGSSGSSAGPAAATAAGLIPFALGTETGGSITYPATTCGVTAHRSSFGLVGRSNIMSLAESLVRQNQGFLLLLLNCRSCLK